MSKKRKKTARERKRDWQKVRATSDHHSITKLGLAWLRDPGNNEVGLEGGSFLLPQYKLTTNLTSESQITLASREM